MFYGLWFFFCLQTAFSYQPQTIELVANGSKKKVIISDKRRAGREKKNFFVHTQHVAKNIYIIETRNFTFIVLLFSDISFYSISFCLSIYLHTKA